MLQSYRIGFATNSSSAHSVIFHSSARRVATGYAPTEFFGDADYGRDTFVYADPRDKIAYAIWVNARYRRLPETAHGRMQLKVALQRLGHGDLDIAKILEANYESPAQAALCPAGVDLGLWLEFLMDPAIVIVGYDDNYDFDFRALEGDIAAVTVPGGEDAVFRQDGPDSLAFFDRSSGTKGRWSRKPYLKSGAPELVDVKITDHCGHGCKFCYQGSTGAGQHAPLSRIRKIFRELAEHGVFEVAIGGGEPVTHPDFPKILAAAKNAGITPNFTTYGVDWSDRPADPHHDAPMVSFLKKTFLWNQGFGIGVSVHARPDVEKTLRLKENLRQAGVYAARVMGQTVVGATPLEATEVMLEASVAANMPMLLLGFKETGRGKGFRRRDRDLAGDRATLKRILERASAAAKNDSYDGFALSVDTAFLDAHGDILDEMGVPEILRTSPEGKFSMYIDAVADTVAPSSYCAPDLVEKRRPGALLEQFAAW